MSIARGALLIGLAIAASAATGQDKKDTRKVDQQLNQALAAKASAEPRRPDVGQIEYENSCAACHGLAGKGMGPYSDSLKRSPPDLTTLAKRNGGVLPLARIYATIEGPEASHGTREMPIWGRRYRIEAPAYHYHEIPPDASAIHVRGRILSLVDYLNRIQEK